MHLILREILGQQAGTSLAVVGTRVGPVQALWAAAPAAAVLFLVVVAFVWCWRRRRHPWAALSSPPAPIVSLILGLQFIVPLALLSLGGRSYGNCAAPATQWVALILGINCPFLIGVILVAGRPEAAYPSRRVFWLVLFAPAIYCLQVLLMSTAADAYWDKSRPAAGGILGLSELPADTWLDMVSWWSLAAVAAAALVGIAIVQGLHSFRRLPES